jgi:hypothetical protein
MNDPMYSEVDTNNLESVGRRKHKRKRVSVADSGRTAKYTGRGKSSRKKKITKK